jgi:hypothetical protein
VTAAQSAQAAQHVTAAQPAQEAQDVAICCRPQLPYMLQLRRGLKTKHLTDDNSRVGEEKYAISFSFRPEEMVGAAECGMKSLGFVGACLCSAPTACPPLHSSGPRLQAKQEKRRIHSNRFKSTSGVKLTALADTKTEMMKLRLAFCLFNLDRNRIQIRIHLNCSKHFIAIRYKKKPGQKKFFEPHFYTISLKENKDTKYGIF